MKNFLLLIFVFALTQSAYASGPSGSGYITEFYTNASGSMARVKFSTPIANPDNCEAGDYYIVELDDSAGSNRYYSALLMAFTTKKIVNFWIIGCTNTKYWGHTRPKLHDVYIQQ